MTKSPMTPFEFDSRMVEWNLKHSMITKDQLNTYLGSLANDEANAEPIHIEDEGIEGGRREDSGPGEELS